MMAIRRSLLTFTLSALAGLLLGAGCRWPDSSPPSTNGQASPDSSSRSIGLRDAPTFPGRRDREPNVRVVDLMFDVVRIDFPVHNHRHSLKVWNHVDNRGVDPETVQRLARNGLRVGSAAPEAWPAMVTIFQAADARVGRDRLLAPRGLPMIIKLGTVDEPESVFRYLAGGQLVGKTLTGGDKLLIVDYVFHPRMGGVTDLRVGFEVRHDRGELTWERRAGIIQQTPTWDRELFDELQTTTTLKSGQFLVIGVAGGTDHAYLAGSRLLTRAESGEQYESMLCIAPKAFQTEGDRPLSLGD
jgi:hypothetical protein